MAQLPCWILVVRLLEQLGVFILPGLWADLW